MLGIDTRVRENNLGIINVIITKDKYGINVWIAYRLWIIMINIVILCVGFVILEKGCEK